MLFSFSISLNILLFLLLTYFVLSLSSDKNCTLCIAESLLHGARTEERWCEDPMALDFRNRR